MTGGSQSPRNRRFDRLHPFLELALLEGNLADARQRLEDLLLTGGLEILRV